jgi:hypothetical protein
MRAVYTLSHSPQVIHPGTYDLPQLAFPFVFLFRLSDSLPDHIRDSIRAAYTRAASRQCVVRLLNLSELRSRIWVCVVVRVE